MEPSRRREKRLPDQPVTTAFVTFETATRSAADNPINSSPQNPI
jgi:hypothetical protein